MNEFSDSIKRVLKNAEEEMFKLNHPYVGSEHLLLSLLKCDCIIDIVKNYNISYKIVKD